MYDGFHFFIFYRGFMRNILLAFLVLSHFAIAGSNGNKVINIKKTADPISIDGAIDPVWDTTDSIANFIQFQPYNGKEPSYTTIAKVLTTESALYCLMICREDKNSIQSNAGKLDDGGNSDIVSIMLDTFGDNRTAYKFAVTATGVRADCRLLDDARNRDYSWDGVWFAASKVYDWGFVIEMEIPYRSIQYDENLTEWGLDFDRWVPARNEDIYWCPYEENEGQRISKFGKLMFTDYRPSVKGLNLEVYPVGISKATYLEDGKYKIEPDAGIDIFYNPSQKLTYQLTANPDFAQIEADPFNFNISRYESYFDERRPFFTQGNEVFMPSGRERNSGFYRPLELFYSRRIGKKLSDGTDVPLYFGTKATGRIDDWEYGGFLARTGPTDYKSEGSATTEKGAYFTSGRVKKQILDNSSIGVLYVGKHSPIDDNGVIDIDGAFRASDWQLSYQIARSYRNGKGDFALAMGTKISKENWFTGIRGNWIGNNFDISQVGYVPWTGTAEFVALTGPRWFFDQGPVSQILLYVGPTLYYERIDGFTDYAGLIGFNMNFRSNWGFEININAGKSKDQGIKYPSYQANLSSWFNTAKLNGNVYGGYTKTYNFSRNYLSFYSWAGCFVGWQAWNILQLGSSLDMYIEGNPDNNIQDITLNSRPYVSVTPINDLSVRVYLDNVYFRSTDHLEQVIVGFLFSYNFLPKSWIYLALNDVQDRSNQYDAIGNQLPNKMHTTSRAGVLKVKYLYYF